jgi:hypothetical protein
MQLRKWPIETRTLAIPARRAGLAATCPAIVPLSVMIENEHSKFRLTWFRKQVYCLTLETEHRILCQKVGAFTAFDGGG